MPVTFVDPPPTGRRLSASSPFPGRVMTSLVPADVPRKKRSSSSSSGRRVRHSVGSYTGAPGPVPENPFADDSGVARAAGSSNVSAVAAGQDYERMSPQADSLPPPMLYREVGDAERQPLLGTVQEEEDSQRLDVPWAFTLAIAAAIGVATFVILYIWRMAEEEGTMARA